MRRRALRLLGAVTLGCACSSAAPSSTWSGKALPDASTAFALPDALPACSGSQTPSSGATSDAGDPLCNPAIHSVSYANDVIPVLSGCSGEVCHGVWTYGTLVGEKSTACCDHRLLVAPGLPSRSHLIQAVSGISDCVSRMPLDLAPLSDNQIATLIAWVCQGATNN